MEKLLLVVDGSGIARSIYEQAEKGGASVDEMVWSSLRSFRRSLEFHDPSHAFIAFDPEGASFRQDIYPAYKVSRPKRPPKYLEVLERVRDGLSEMGVFHADVSGYEADDVIGTVARKGVDAGFSVVVQARDKDMWVLLEDGVKIHSHFERAWIDRQWCRDRCGVDPHLIPEWLALAGDGVDGIPGVDLVGATTAAKWLSAYGSLPAVVAAAERGDIRGKAAKNLIAAKDDLPLYLQLATLRFDVPVGVARWRDLRLSSEQSEHRQDQLGHPPEMDPGYMRSLMELPG